jgi:hypothetical protein
MNVNNTLEELHRIVAHVQELEDQQPVASDWTEEIVAARRHGAELAGEAVAAIRPDIVRLRELAQQHDTLLAFEQWFRALDRRAITRRMSTLMDKKFEDANLSVTGFPLRPPAAPGPTLLR